MLVFDIILIMFVASNVAGVSVSSGLPPPPPPSYGYPYPPAPPPPPPAAGRGFGGPPRSGIHYPSQNPHHLGARPPTIQKETASSQTEGK